jgi:DNA polymerase I-like protein with 3'-5' exonuclease and polymerase domains
MNAIAFDTETKGFDWWDPFNQAFLVTWADAAGTWAADVSDEAGIGRFRKACEDAEIIIGHNLKFDVHQVRHTLGFDPVAGKQVADTDTLSRLLHPELSQHGLKPLAVVYLGDTSADAQDKIKEMGKELGLNMSPQNMTPQAYWIIYKAYPKIMTDYALQDARMTYDLWEKFSAEIEQPEFAKIQYLYELEMEVQSLLMEAEEVGITTDQDQARVLKERFTSDREATHGRLEEVLGSQALGGEGSEQALIEALLALGVPLVEVTDSGKLATNKKALQPFVKDFPIIEDLFEMRRLDRFLSTYIGPIERNYVIHTNFVPIGAWTGRMACRSPNMQNWPKRAGKEVRSVLVPRPGYAFVVCDFESIEMRILAYYLGDQEFREMVVERDSHAWMASQIWGGEPSEYAKGGPQDNLRALAKNILFAITYGAGGPKIQSMLRDAGMEVSVPRAKEIASVIKKSLPGYWRLMKRVRSKIENLGYVNTILGRKNTVNKEKAYVGLNALIQGSAADIMKLACRDICEVYALDNEINLLLVVHDEAVIECPISVADAVLTKVTSIMEHCIPQLPVPLSVEGSITTESYAHA